MLRLFTAAIIGLLLTVEVFAQASAPLTAKELMTALAAERTEMCPRVTERRTCESAYSAVIAAIRDMAAVRAGQKPAMDESEAAVKSRGMQAVRALDQFKLRHPELFPGFTPSKTPAEKRGRGSSIFISR